MSAKRKQSLYFPEEDYNEIRAEAERQGRSVSMVMQMAWKIARGQLRVYGDHYRKATKEIGAD